MVREYTLSKEVEVNIAELAYNHGMMSLTDYVDFYLSDTTKVVDKETSDKLREFSQGLTDDHDVDAIRVRFYRLFLEKTDREVLGVVENLMRKWSKIDWINFFSVISDAVNSWETTGKPIIDARDYARERLAELGESV